ncbi:hypothetical protein ACYSNR_01945 [Enterococcus sp. LJL128]
MARLSDYGFDTSKLSNQATVTIKGKDFPINFTMETMEYVADCYGGDYSIFENDMNDMLKRSGGKITLSTLSPGDFKIMRALIYGMLRSGGLDEDLETITTFIGMGKDVISVYGVCMELFTNQTFQVEDLKKSRKPQDHQRKNQKRKQLK